MSGEEDRVQFPTGAVRGTDTSGLRYDLVPQVGLRRVAEAMAEGASKYPPGNWLKGIPSSVHLNHAAVHLNRYFDGDRSEDHLGHAIADLMMACHNEERRPDMHDMDALRQLVPDPPDALDQFSAGHAGQSMAPRGSDLARDLHIATTLAAILDRLNKMSTLPLWGNPEVIINPPGTTEGSAFCADCGFQMQPMESGPIACSNSSCPGRILRPSQDAPVITFGEKVRRCLASTKFGFGDIDPGGRKRSVLVIIDGEMYEIDDSPLAHPAGPVRSWYSGSVLGQAEKIRVALESEGLWSGEVTPQPDEFEKVSVMVSGNFSGRIMAALQKAAIPFRDFDAINEGRVRFFVGDIPYTAWMNPPVRGFGHRVCVGSGYFPATPFAKELESRLQKAGAWDIPEAAP
jgi:hypothetical protein